MYNNSCLSAGIHARVSGVRCLNHVNVYKVSAEQKAKSDIKSNEEHLKNFNKYITQKDNTL